jgi:hypothetical protein
MACRSVFDGCRSDFRRISARDLLARIDRTGAVVDHQALAARALPRNLDRARWIRVTGHPVVNGKGYRQRGGDNNARTNDDLSGAIFHRPTPIRSRRNVVLQLMVTKA